MTQTATPLIESTEPYCMAPVAASPSRSTNPFATCWTRPGAIPFQFRNGQDADQVVAQLATLQWRGAIIGPHGSGKSTLLEPIKPVLREAGFQVRAVSLRDHQRRLPARFLHRPPKTRIVVIVDGYEQLGGFDRFRLHWLWRQAEIGLLVTAHSETRIPTLVRLTPDEQLVQHLAAILVAKGSTPITPADVAASHARHGNNVREIFFDLYDRHEKLRCASQDLPLSVCGQPLAGRRQIITDGRLPRFSYRS
jgi:hypothetical protein